MRASETETQSFFEPHRNLFSTGHRPNIPASGRSNVALAVSDVSSALLRNAHPRCRTYRSSAPKTRLLLGLGLIAWGTIGLYSTDTAEKAFDMVPTDEDKKKLDQSIPKIRVVDKE